MIRSRSRHLKAFIVLEMRTCLRRKLNNASQKQTVKEDLSKIKIKSFSYPGKGTSNSLRLEFNKFGTTESVIATFKDTRVFVTASLDGKNGVTEVDYHVPSNAHNKYISPPERDTYLKRLPILCAEAVERSVKLCIPEGEQTSLKINCFVMSKDVSDDHLMIAINGVHSVLWRMDMQLSFHRLVAVRICWSRNKPDLKKDVCLNPGHIQRDQSTSSALVLYFLTHVTLGDLKKKVKYHILDFSGTIHPSFDLVWYKGFISATKYERQFQSLVSDTMCHVEVSPEVNPKQTSQQIIRRNDKKVNKKVPELEIGNFDEAEIVGKSSEINPEQTSQQSIRRNDKKVNKKIPDLEMGNSYEAEIVGKSSEINPEQTSQQSIRRNDKKVNKKIPDLEMGNSYEAEIVGKSEKHFTISLHPDLEDIVLDVSQVHTTPLPSTELSDLHIGDKIHVKYFGQDDISGEMRVSHTAYLLSKDLEQAEDCG